MIQYSDFDCCNVLILTPLRDTTGTTPAGHRDTTGTPPGPHWDTTGKPPGHHRDTTGTPPGHHRDTTGTPSRPHWDTTGKPPGHHREAWMCPNQNTNTQRPCDVIFYRTQHVDKSAWLPIYKNTSGRCFSKHGQCSRLSKGV